MKRKKNVERKRGKRGERRFRVLFLRSKKTLSLMNVQGSGGVTSSGGLWVSRRVGFQGFGTPGEEGGRKGPQMEEEGDPFFFPPALSCDHRACGGSCTVCVSPRPGRPVEDRGGSSEASLDLLEGAQAFVWSHCWCLGSPGRQRSVAARPPPPHSSVTWRG